MSHIATARRGRCPLVPHRVPCQVELLERRVLWAIGGLDPSFGGGGTVFDDVSSGGPDNAVDVAVDASGRTVVVGSISDGGEYGPVLRRYLANGAVDTAFGRGAGKVLLGSDEVAYIVRLQDDGKILVGGQHWAWDETGQVHIDFGLFRFNADGSIDRSFGGGDGIAIADFDGRREEVMGLAIQSDGKIVAVGYTHDSGFGGETGRQGDALGVARFNADGTLDTTFASHGTFTHRAGAAATYGWDVALQQDGKLVIAGWTTVYAEISRSRSMLARLNIDGTLDNSFGAGGVITSANQQHNPGYRAVEIDAEGRIIAAGGDPNGPIVARHHSNGALDETFGDDGIARIGPSGGAGHASDVALDEHGYVYAAADALLRLTPAGTFDGSASVAAGSDAHGRRIEVQADGKIVMMTSLANYPTAHFVVSRFNPGSAPPSVLPPSGGDGLTVQGATGDQYALPQRGRDGSINLAGTEAAEVITVERIAALGELKAELQQYVYVDTAIGLARIGLADALAPGRLQQQLAAKHPALADALATALAAANDFIRVTVEGVYEVYVTHSASAKESARVRIDARGGHDVVAIANAVPLKATIVGGWGADKLTTGKKLALVLGGGGGDRLFSRSRYGGTLDGGTGADRYYNRFGDVQICARNDGDSVVVDDVPVRVNSTGVLRIELETGVIYFFPNDSEDVLELTG